MDIVATLVLMPSQTISKDSKHNIEEISSTSEHPTFYFDSNPGDEARQAMDGNSI